MKRQLLSVVHIMQSSKCVSIAVGLCLKIKLFLDIQSWNTRKYSSFIHIHACGDIMIQEILCHYHNIDNYIIIIGITIISYITTSLT